MLKITRSNLITGLSGFKSAAFSSDGFPASKTHLVKKFLPATILSLVIVIVLFVAGKFLINAFSNSAKSSDQRITVANARKTVAINKEFNFPIKDDKGKEVTRLKYVIQSADLRDEIIVKGQRAISVKGRTFFIVTIKLTNDYDKSIDFFSRDYLRLSINNNRKDLLAADIHNDPVRVQGISTKETRLGFPVNDTDRDFLLLIGDGKNFNTEIPVKF